MPFLGIRFDPTKYGSWSVVTGATSGIGKYLAFELAGKYSNLVLIGRNDKLLEELKDQIERRYKVAIILIVKDFNLSQDYDVIEKVISPLDVGVLVNNVGTSHNAVTEIYNQTDFSCESLLLVNQLSAIMMTKMVLPKMLARRKGVIVNIGSATSYFPFMYMGIYPSTKKFLNFFNQTLINEYPFSKFGVYFHCINPFYVATKMSGVRPSFFIPTPQYFAQSSIDTFEYTGESNGCMLHHLQALFLKLTPGLIKSILITPIMKKMKEAYEKRLRQKKE